MSNKYYHSETVEFQNGDFTVAKQLTIKPLKALTKLFTSHDSEQRKNERRIQAAIAAAKKGNKVVDEQDIYESEVEAIREEGGKTYLDVLMDGCLIALASWKVKGQDQKFVEVDLDYIEENLDYPTMSKICEIAGSMELGDKAKADGAEGKG